VFKPDLDSRDLREKRKKDEPPVERIEEEKPAKLTFKIRFDYRGNPRPARFFFGRKKTEAVAEEIREQQIALWRNMPLQGIQVESIDLGEIYSLYDEHKDEDVAFAPLEIRVRADTIEDILRFVLREEFRKIEILEPPSIKLSSKEAERFLFKVYDLHRERLLARLKESSK